MKNDKGFFTEKNLNSIDLRLKSTRVKSTIGLVFFLLTYWLLGAVGKNLPSLSETTILPESQAATTAASPTTGWIKEIGVSTTPLSSYPSTPLITDMYPTPGKEIAYINSDGELVIYDAGGNLIINTAGVAGAINSFAAANYTPTAIDLNNNSGAGLYELLVPGQGPTANSGTLKGFDGSGVAIAGFNASFDQGRPRDAAAVDNWDDDAAGSPEIFLAINNDTVSPYTATLLGWAWNKSAQTLSGLNQGNPVLLTVTGVNGYKPVFTSPAIGNITPDQGKEVAAAVEVAEGDMRIYVIRKNGNGISYVTSGTPENPPTPTGSTWHEERIDEPVLGTTPVTLPTAGGIALVDFNNDGIDEMAVVTGSKYGFNNGVYSIRTYRHDSTTNTAKVFAAKLEIAGVPGIWRSPTSPAIGSFEGHTKTVVFKSAYTNNNNDNYDGFGLFAGYYDGSTSPGVMRWVTNYSPRQITSLLSPVCNVRRETTTSSVTLADTNGNGANEALYQKYYTVPQTFYTLFYYRAEGAPVDNPDCGPNSPLDYQDAPEFANSQNTSGIANQIASNTNIEVADVDGNGTIEAMVTYGYLKSLNNFNYLRLIPFTSVSLPTDWPMTGGNPCRQGRYGGACPPALAAPPATATCTGIKYYSTSWAPLSKSQIQPGQTVNIACTATVDYGSLDRARFCVLPGANTCPAFSADPSKWAESPLKNASNEFYTTFTFPTGGPTNFAVAAEVHVANGSWY